MFFGIDFSVSELNSKSGIKSVDQLPVNFSINDIEHSFIMTNTSRIIDLPDNVNASSWCVIFTCKLGKSTGVQYISSIFTSNNKIYKRTLSSEKWTDFVTIN